VSGVSRICCAQVVIAVVLATKESDQIAIVKQKSLQEHALVALIGMLVPHYPLGAKISISIS
jgi:hypothetical protein